MVYSKNHCIIMPFKEFGVITSTPNMSREKRSMNISDVSIVEPTPSPPLLITDGSLNTSPDCDCGSRNNEFQTQKNVNEASAIKNKTVDCVCSTTVEKESKRGPARASSFSARDASKGSVSRAHNMSELTNCECGPSSLAQLTAKHHEQNREIIFGRKQIRARAVKAKKMKQEKQNCEDDNSVCNESVRAPSLAGSSTSEAARAHSLESKLLATMQILKNKEETVRVQAESLSLAEARIAALSSKFNQSTQKLHQAQQTHPPYSSLQQRSVSVGRHVQMTDVSASTDLQEMDHKIVNTLQDNLSVIEELYRECFYESAKQEELVNMLRRSYLDIRLMERQKTEQIGHLQSVVYSQRCSLDKCQDIALEVENLKSEISNFLNSSQNNDSGVWVEEGADMCAELRDIARLLRRLRDVLDTDCLCGLEEENKKLKRINETMETEIRELRQKVNDLEEALEDKENLDRQCQLRIQEKEQELRHIRHQLGALEEGSRDQDTTCDALKLKLKQMEVLLNDKTSELLSVQHQCDSQEATIKELREELNRADLKAQESGEVRREVWGLSGQVRQWREQLAATRARLRALEAELQRARDHCRHLADHYRAKAGEADELQGELEEAQRRGAELCGEARRAVCGVRGWLREHRRRAREQEEKIKQQEALIYALQHGVAMKSNTEHTSDNEPCCSKYLPRMEASDRSSVCPSETRSCSKCPSSRKMHLRTSESDAASSPSPPTPPKRFLRKKPLCGNTHCQWQPAGGGSQRTASVHTHTTTNREASPADELLERVERAHAALSAAHRRWSRRTPAHAGPN